MGNRAVLAEVRARVRADGGELYVAVGTDREGRRVRCEAAAEIDARHFAFDLRMNGWTDVVIERVGDCDICGQALRSERVVDDGGEVAHAACVGQWFRHNFGREGLS